MRSDVLKLAGAAGLIFAAALFVQLVTYWISGAAIYGENYEHTLEQIIYHRTAFTLSAGSGAVAAACLLPIAAGIFFRVEEEFRPMAALAGLFLVLSAVLTIVAYGSYGNLVGTAMDFQHHLIAQSI